MLCDFFYKQYVSLLNHSKASSIAAIVGVVRPFIFSAASLIDAICSSYGGLLDGAVVMGKSLSFFGCVVRVLLLFTFLL